MRFLHKIAAVAVAACLAVTFVAGAVVAQVVEPAVTTVHVGSTINDLLIAYVGVIGTIVSGVITVLGYKFFGIRADQNARDTLNSLAQNLAGKFLVNKESIVGLNIDAHNQEIAALANGGLDRAKDALDRFGLGPLALQERIVEAIGKMTAAATATPAVDAVPPKV